MIDGLTNSGIPLGGLGTGSVELRRDGYFHEWQLMNNAPWGCGPSVDFSLETSFFGVQVHGNNINQTAILGTPPDYANRHNHFLNDPYHQPWIKHARSIKAETQAPFTRLDYTIKDFPVAVKLEAFSPFIPLDAKNSALPLAYFRFTLTNRTSRQLQVSLFNAQKNLVGYSEAEKLSRMTFVQQRGVAYIRMEREKLSRHCSSKGSLVIGAICPKGQSSYVFHPRTARDLYEPLRASGLLENRDCGNFKGQVGDAGAGLARQLRQGPAFGALSQTLKLAPRASETVIYVLAWHFPEMWDQAYQPKKAPARRLDHQYSLWFKDAAEVFHYAVQNAATLRQRTREFTEAYYRSTFPRWLLDAIAAQFTTLVKASWWDKQGHFGIWEGLGCCGLQTTDITHYGSFPIIQFFPKIQQSQMRLTRKNIEGPGKIPHMMPGNFSCGDLDSKNRIDLIPQFILLVWRDVLWTGDLAYAREMWPAIKEALRHFDTFDTDGDGLPNNKGPDQTYDQFPLKGTSSLVGFLYAGALQAACDLATQLGERHAADEARNRLAEALRKLDDQLWNGRYYRLSHNPADGKNNEGVMVDQVNADWFVRQARGEGLLPDDNVRSAMRQILKYCSEPEGYLANCKWPAGNEIAIGRHTSNQACNPWSGVEYAFAAHLVLLGLERAGLKVARDVWDRYERAGLRFNHIECGAHYYRALSSWAIYLALTGVCPNASRKALALRIRKAPGTFVFNTPTCWGEAHTAPKGLLVELQLRRGALTLRELDLRGLDARSVSVTAAGKRLATSCAKSGDSLRIILKSPVTLKENDVLRLTL